MPPGIRRLWGTRIKRVAWAPRPRGRAAYTGSTRTPPQKATWSLIAAAAGDGSG